jgi:hypothetical protein
VTKKIREKYIFFSKNIGIPIKGYYFKTNLERSLKWNNNRSGKEKIPEIGILGMHKKLEIPSIEEGFDELFYVDIIDGKYIVKEWKNEI